MKSTEKQRAAQVANWHRRQVLGACAIVNIPTLGNAEDDADLRVAQEALRKIRDRHSYRQHIRGLLVEARRMARESTPEEIRKTLELHEDWNLAPEAREVLQKALERRRSRNHETKD